MLSKNHKWWKNNTSVLLICILLSFVFWIMQKLSGEHIFTLPVQIKYDLPDGKGIDTDTPNQLEVLFKGRGWEITKLSILKDLHITVPLSEDETQNFNESFLKNVIQAALHSMPLQVLDIRPNELSVELYQTFLKRVPLQLDIDVQFFPDFDFSKPIVLKPDSVTLYGAKELLDTIQVWTTEKLVLDKLKKNISKTLKLKSPGNIALQISEYSALVEIFVEEYTERIFELPIIVVSAEGKSLNTYKTLPDKARVYAVLPLSKYDDPLPDEFKLVVIVDTKEQYIAQNSKPLTLSLYPNYIKSLKIHPPQIEIFQLDQ